MQIALLPTVIFPGLMLVTATYNQPMIALCVSLRRSCSHYLIYIASGSVVVG
jgi:hypothetical protein